MNFDINFSKIFSPSRISMFDICPKQYHFYYLDPIYSKMKNTLKRKSQHIWPFYTLGKAVHNAITLFYHDTQTHSLQKLKDSLKEVWQSEVEPRKKPPLLKWGGFATIEEEREAYRQALLMLNNFYGCQINPEVEYLPTADFSHSIKDYTDLITPLSSDFDISGKFDLVAKEKNGNLHIIDFKTSKKEEANPFQLKFYKVLAESKFGKKVEKASFYFLRTGKKQEFALDKDSLEALREEILKKIELIGKTQNFDPLPGKLCRFCLFRTFCPQKEEVKKFINESEKEDFSDDLPF